MIIEYLNADYQNSNLILPAEADFTCDFLDLQAEAKNHDLSLFRSAINMLLRDVCYRDKYKGKEFDPSRFDLGTIRSIEYGFEDFFAERGKVDTHIVFKNFDRLAEIGDMFQAELLTTIQYSFFIVFVQNQCAGKGFMLGKDTGFEEILTYKLYCHYSEP